MRYTIGNFSEIVVKLFVGSVSLQNMDHLYEIIRGIPELNPMEVCITQASTSEFEMPLFDALTEALGTINPTPTVQSTRRTNSSSIKL